MKKIQNLISLLSLIFFLNACSSLDMPSIEESQAIIKSNEEKIEANTKIIKSKSAFLQKGNDLICNVKIDMLNKLIGKIANFRDNDISIYFRPKKDFIKEDKKVLGIEYSNYLALDTGKIDLNIKKLQFESQSGNKLTAIIELEGKGNINVSGKYTGIPASAKPEVYLYLNDKIVFNIETAESGIVVLKPEPKKLNLKTKISIKLLEWSIPYNQEIPLETVDLIKPIKIPIALSKEIPFPIPAQQNSGSKLEFVAYMIDLSQAQISIKNNTIDYRSHFDIRKK